MAQDPVKDTGIILIGGSSGSLEVVVKILPALKHAFPVPILLVMHRNSTADSGLTELLSSRSTLQVKEVDDKDILEKGFVYIAPPDYHVLVETDGTLSLDASEKVHYCRPGIDVSFVSAAVAYQNRVVAILLSGANIDGTDGMKTIKDAGGFTIVQEPEEAVVSFMPDQAIAAKAFDRIMTTEQIIEWLNTLEG